MRRIIVTGGAGFIGSWLVRELLQAGDTFVINFDKLTYAADEEGVKAHAKNVNHVFEQGDVCDTAHMGALLRRYEPDAVMHLAAESHVDRSIDGAEDFIQTNIVGTFRILEATRQYWSALSAENRQRFRFHHISTDEVFGSLGATGKFSETTAYQPNSPYSASKAASDHLVRAWHATHGLPVVVTNCSNNYGPYQFPEKLIPLTIVRALLGQSLPVYGRGDNIRDWLYVEDHARALIKACFEGKLGETYNVGGGHEATNIEIVRTICGLIDEMAPDTSIGPREALIEFVTDRPGHDHRYAIDASKIELDLGWSPRESFASGLRKTVAWYMENREWWERIRARRYSGGRLGVAASPAISVEAGVS